MVCVAVVTGRSRRFATKHRGALQVLRERRGSRVCGAVTVFIGLEWWCTFDKPHAKMRHTIPTILGVNRSGTSKSLGSPRNRRSAECRPNTYRVEPVPFATVTSASKVQAAFVDSCIHCLCDGALTESRSGPTIATTGEWAYYVSVILYTLPS